jgi:hypothetical protein
MRPLHWSQSMSVVAAGSGDPEPASTSNSRRLGRRSQGQESEHCLQITHTPNRSYDCGITVAYPISHRQNHRRPQYPLHSSCSAQIDLQAADSRARHAFTLQTRFAAPANPRDSSTKLGRHVFSLQEHAITGSDSLTGKRVNARSTDSRFTPVESYKRDE